MAVVSPIRTPNVAAHLCAVSEVLGFFPLELPGWDIPGECKEDGML